MDEYEYYLHQMIWPEDEELNKYKQEIEIINCKIQELSNYLIDKNNIEKEEYLRITFPYGIIRTVTKCKSLLDCVDDDIIKTNIAYSLMLSDLNACLINRTTIKGTLQEMIIKHNIILMASICEALSAVYASKKISYKKRIEKIYEINIINDNLKNDLEWLWDQRGIHIYELDEKEYNKYKIDDFNKSIRTTIDFIEALNKKKNSLH
jgi:hypothetical protein